MPNPLTWSLPADLETAVTAALREWTAERRVARLWARDAALWTGDDEASWLGWLGIVDEQIGRVAELQRIAEDVRAGGLHPRPAPRDGRLQPVPRGPRPHVRKAGGWPELSVLDSTDPAQVRAAEARVDLGRTLFVVSSKSGTTLEPNIFKQYFFERVRQTVGPGKVGAHFVAITDPGSKLEQAARADGFRHVLFGLPSIGGRYSALSDFGMAPGALMGVDVSRLLHAARTMARACAAEGPAADNPGAALGAVLGVLASRGRDKVTLVASPGIHDLGAWLEQLLAESTGKAGKGLIPVDREPIGPPDVYGRDRLFVYVRLDSAPDPDQDRRVAGLQAAGQPVVRIGVPEAYQIGAEFFRWEFATAVAGSILGINPSTSPTSRPARSRRGGSPRSSRRPGACPTRRRSSKPRASGSSPIPRNARDLAAGGRTLAGVLRAHLARIRPGDYAALLAYVEMTAAHEATLAGDPHAPPRPAPRRHLPRLRPAVPPLDGSGVQGRAEHGRVPADHLRRRPRSARARPALHASASSRRRRPVATSRSLLERGRRALRVHLGADVSAGLAILREGHRGGGRLTGRRPASHREPAERGPERADRDDRAGPDGRQHGAPAPPRRPSRGRRYATDAQAVREVAHEGALGAASLDELVASLEPPRAVWVMVPGRSAHGAGDRRSRPSA